VRGGARRDFLPGYNLVILVHKTSGNRGIYPRHLEKEIGGKRSWQARMRRNKSRRFAKAYAKLQLFAVVMEECVEFNVGLFGLATLRKGLGARRGLYRRTQRNSERHPMTVSARLRSIATRTQGEWVQGFAVFVVLGRNQGQGGRHPHSAHRRRRHTKSGWKRLPQTNRDHKIWTCSDHSQRGQPSVVQCSGFQATLALCKTYGANVLLKDLGPAEQAILAKDAFGSADLRPDMNDPKQRALTECSSERLRPQHHSRVK
jgi:hypothetical protein